MTCYEDQQMVKLLRNEVDCFCRHHQEKHSTISNKPRKIGRFRDPQTYYRRDLPSMQLSDGTASFSYGNKYACVMQTHRTNSPCFVLDEVDIARIMANSNCSICCEATPVGPGSHDGDHVERHSHASLVGDHMLTVRPSRLYFSQTPLFLHTTIWL